MVKTETVRLLTWDISLGCGHTARYRCAGWYPAAIASPDGGLCWATGLTLVCEERIRQTPGTTHLATILDTWPSPPRPATTPSSPAQPPPQPYVVDVQGSRSDPPFDYTVQAVHLADAVTRAARQYLADLGEPDTALIDLDTDGLPYVHVCDVCLGTLTPAATPVTRTGPYEDGRS